jgi:hypothetical protein
VLPSVVALAVDFATLKKFVPTVSTAGSRRGPFTMYLINSHAFGSRVGTAETSQRRFVAGCPSAKAYGFASVNGSWIRVLDRTDQVCRPRPQVSDGDIGYEVAGRFIETLSSPYDSTARVGDRPRVSCRSQEISRLGPRRNHRGWYSDEICNDEYPHH